MAKRIDPAKWLTSEGLDAIHTWAEQGLDMKQIAKCMGIGKSTLYDWMNRYSDILDALTRGRGIADTVVENKAFLSACGYDVEESEVREVIDKVTGRVVKLTTKRKRHIPPDVRAQQFWLVNRCPDRWHGMSHAPKVDESDSTGGVIEITAVVMPETPNDTEGSP